MVHVSTTFYKLTKFDYVTDDGKRHCHLISYGGGGGGVTGEDDDETSAGNEIRIHLRNSNDKNGTGKRTTPSKNEYHVRRFNVSGGDASSTSSSPIRAIACSPDGKRVAVGFDDGSTRIYTYDKIEVKEKKQGDDDDNNDDEMMLHPFLRHLIKPTTTNDNSSSSSTVGDQDENEEEHYFAGPRVSASIRDLVFDPRSRPCGGASGTGCRRYLLAVATEDHGDGLFVVNVLSPDTVLQDKFLSDDSHSYGGVRSICYSTPPISFSSNNGDEESVTFLAALGQDGYITLYCCNGIETPDLSWSEWYRSHRPVVPSKDLGYAIASMTNDTNSDHDNKSSKHLLTAYDRAASVSWSPDGKSLLLMGGNDVELRSLGVTQPNDLEEPTSLFETPRYLLSNVTQHRGHTNAIVSSTFNMDGTLLITLGKDGRICAWDMDPKSYDNTTDSSNTNNSIGRFRCEVEAPISNEEHPISIAFDDATGLLHVVYTSGTLKTFTSSHIRATKTKSSPPTTINTTKDPLVEEEEDNDEAALEIQPPKPNASASLKNPYAKLKTNSNVATESAAASSLKSSPKVDDEDDLLDFDAMNSNAVGSKGKTKSSSSKKSSSKSFIDDEAEADVFDDGDDDNDAFEDFDDGIATLKSPVVSDKEQTQTNGDTGGDTFGGAFQSNDDDGNFDGEEDDVMDLTQNDDTATAKHTNVPVLPAQGEPPQEAFAPSSTPVNVDHPHVRRILCWNHMGVVTSRRDDVDEEQHIVDINLNDTNVFGGAHQHFLDSFGFDQGTLGEDGGMFATYSGTGDDEDEDDVDQSLFGTKKKNVSTMEGSKLFFYRFDTIGSSKHKDWSATLPTGEHALGVACGEGWAAVVTSRRFLRLFTSGGIQRTMICLQGDPVTIVGRGRLVAVMYHMASPLPDKTQQLGYMILDAIECKTLHEGCLNGIQKGQRLTWAGFSNDLSLMIMESSGLVSMLSVSSGWQWVPVLDTLGKKKSMEDSFWPISVLKGNLVCVPLKGGHEHPDATRRPITTTLELRLPLAQGMKQTMDLEDILIRAEMALGQKKFSDELLLKSGGSKEDLEDEYHVACAQVDKVTIKLFHAALSANSVERALDLVQLLHGEKSYSILLQVSDQMGYDKVTEKIQQFMEAKFPPPPIEEPLYSQDEDGSFHDQHFEEDDNGSRHSWNNHEDHHDDENNTPFEDTQTPFLSNRRKVTPNNRNGNNAFFGQTSSTAMNNNEQHDVEDIDDDDEMPKTMNNTTTKNPFAKSNKRKNNNPFAKTTLQSPTKPLKKIKLNRGGKVISSPPRMQLSRNSTFSVKAKEKQKSMKHFL